MIWTLQLHCFLHAVSQMKTHLPWFFYPEMIAFPYTETLDVAVLLWAGSEGLGRVCVCLVLLDLHKLHSRLSAYMLLTVPLLLLIIWPFIQKRIVICLPLMLRQFRSVLQSKYNLWEIIAINNSPAELVHTIRSEGNFASSPVQKKRGEMNQSYNSLIKTALKLSKLHIVFFFLLLSKNKCQRMTRPSLSLVVKCWVAIVVLDQN